MKPRHRRVGLMTLALAAAVLCNGPAAAAVPEPTYRANDYGNVLNILPPGANGLVTAADALQFEANGTRPAHSNDQYPMYQDLLYGYRGLTDSGLTRFYKDASFGLRPQDIDPAQTVTLSYPPFGNVTIYRDKQFGTPHVYGDTVQAMAYGAGYATAHDRLFMIDVLRYTGRGHITELVGPSCGDEAMDRSQLALTGYTQQDKQAQLDYIAHNLGPLGAEARTMITGEVQGINKYIADAELNPTSMMPVEYPAVTGGPPGLWQDSDIIDIASLVGGIFGKGGGNEVAGGHLFQYLKAHFGTTAAQAMFRDFRQVDDPNGPSTVSDRSFPYNVHDPGMLPTAKNAFTDPAAPVTDPMSAALDPGCDANPALVADIGALLSGLTAHSNALVVDARHSTSGRPIAVFGPQVGYFAPQILMEVDLHAPDYDVRGASFPGTAFLVELGRGQDYAWSATSAGNDLVDQRIEVLCPTPTSDTDPKARYYMSNGACTRMDYHQDTEVAVSKAGGQSTCNGCTIRHDIYRTHHALADAVVIGFTRMPDGTPVAISSQRSTYGHELDSAVGFLRWQHPSLTHDARSWMVGAANIGYTFNWLYADNRDIAYFDSGLDPLRQPDYNPDLPSLGTGVAEWTGFLSTAAHPQEINPSSGYFVSWNNKQAPGFAANDAEYSYGPIYRSLSLERRVQSAFAAKGRITRADLVSAMEDAASVDLTGAHVVPELEALRATVTSALSSTDAAHANAVLDALSAWAAGGSHRVRAAHGDAQYRDAAAVAVMDELNPRLIEALFDSVLKDPALGAGVNLDNHGVATGYSKHPTAFADLPSGNLGSAYNGGWESYTFKALRQLRGLPPAAPLSADMTARLCGGGIGSCPSAIGAALVATYNQLASINGTDNVAAWTADTDSAGARSTIPAGDTIHFRGVGVVGQPNMDWQNRPTFQQVVDFPTHRPRDATVPAVSAGGPTGSLPRTSRAPGLPADPALAFVLSAIAGALLALRRRENRSG